MQYLTLFAGALLAGSAIAQEPNASFNSSVVAQVAGELDAGTKAAWCTGQQTACTVLCNRDTSVNNCTASTLQYFCTCAANNSAPALQYYNPTMVSYVCGQALGDCLAAHANHQDEQDECKVEFVCGNSSVQAYANSSAGQAPAGSSTSSSTQSATSGTTSGTASPSPSKAAAAALELGATYGTGILATILFGIFGLAL